MRDIVNLKTSGGYVFIRVFHPESINLKKVGINFDYVEKDGSFYDLTEFIPACNFYIFYKSEYLLQPTLEHYYGSDFDYKININMLSISNLVFFFESLSGFPILK